jgi:uncharacterized membrane protein YfcA
MMQWLMVAAAAAFIGLNKAGIVGISLISIPIVAAVFGGKASTGVIASILVIADFIAVISYRKFVHFKKFLGLLPWTFAGMGIALYVGAGISDHLFKIFIAAAIVIALFFMVRSEFKGDPIAVKSSWYLSALVGILGGFTSMIGNVAGPILSVYFLSLQLNKNEFIATRAWFFWITNLCKLPLHIFFWKTVTLNTLAIDILMIPAVAAGALAGIFLVKIIPEKPYRIFLIAVTFVSVIFLIV